MKKIILPLLTMMVVSTAVVGATVSEYSDTETSTNNTFTAGTLDLNVDGGNSNVVKFTVANMKPGSQPTGKYTLKNVGSVNGYLDLHNVSVTGNENGRQEPEITAGDTTDETGELQNVVNMKLYWDNDCDGYWSTGDVYIYNGVTGSVAANYDANKALNAGATQCVMAVFDWWPNTAPYNGTPYHYGDDNLAQGDGMNLDMTFELGQNTTQ